MWDTGAKAGRSHVTTLIPVTASTSDLTLLTTRAEPPTNASPWHVPEAPRAPPGQPALHRSEPQRGMMRPIAPVRKAHWSWKERAAAKTSLNRSAASVSAGESFPSSGLAPMNQVRKIGRAHV